MKYKVKEVYTPDDTDLDRKRYEAEFESDSTDLLELAVQARIACHQPDTRTEETIANIRQHLKHDDVLGQLEGQNQTYFNFLMWGNNGEWEITIETVLTTKPRS